MSKKKQYWRSVTGQDRRRKRPGAKGNAPRAACKAPALIKAWAWPAYRSEQNLLAAICRSDPARAKIGPGPTPTIGICSASRDSHHKQKNNHPLLRCWIPGTPRAAHPERVADSSGGVGRGAGLPRGQIRCGGMSKRAIHAEPIARNALNTATRHTAPA